MSHLKLKFLSWSLQEDISSGSNERYTYSITEYQNSIQSLWIAEFFMKNNMCLFHNKCRKWISINRLQGLCQFAMPCQLLLLITNNGFLIPSALANPLRFAIIQTNGGRIFVLWLGNVVTKHAIW